MRKAAALGPQAWADLATAAAELALARLRLARLGPRDLAGSGPPAPAHANDKRQRTIDRVAFAIPRAAARLPWRTTCLVQALAARRWLARQGIESDLKLGARLADQQQLDAHAWLEVDGRIVVGGDPGDYREFERP